MYDCRAMILKKHRVFALEPKAWHLHPLGDRLVLFSSVSSFLGLSNGAAYAGHPDRARAGSPATYFGFESPRPRQTPTSMHLLSGGSRRSFCLRC